jgi:hypothetical protein
VAHVWSGREQLAGDCQGRSRGHCHSAQWRYNLVVQGSASLPLLALVMNDNDNDNETDPIWSKENGSFFGCAAFFVSRIKFVSDSLCFLLFDVWIIPFRHDQVQKFFVGNLRKKRIKNLSGSLIIIRLAAGNE